MSFRSLARFQSIMASQGKTKPCYPIRLDVADEPKSWESAGFRLDGINVHLGEVTIQLLGRKAGSGIIGWGWLGLPANIDSIHGVPTTTVSVHPRSLQQQQQQSPHPNGATTIDHVVLRSPNVDETIQILSSIANLSPLRETNSVRHGVRQVIYRPSETIVELVGSSKTANRPAYLWGITVTANDVDHTHAVLPKTTKEPWDAVQPGRRITVLASGAHDVSVALAFMSPHVAGLEGKNEDRELLFQRRARAQEKELEERDRKFKSQL
eukprot:m.115344 g.115344  ORF g.115344 m.115344 type:complete len:267 (+) comp28416_c0_seq1:106-906(+)